MENILHYRVIRKLGSGGMGEVWLVEDENIGRMMAFKMINPSMGQDPQLVERFKQEARLQASLNHPNIVTLHTFFQHGSRYIIGMEYATGITLKELIARTGPIHTARAMKIFRQICLALSHSHSKGVYHRDIKPANVMVDIDNGDNVKVMDFGIAKAANGPGLTRTGIQIGTPAYMSPEQIRGIKEIDHRSDIYSLGVLLYHMLCGRPPFDDESMSDFDLRNAVVNTPLPDPLMHYPSIPMWLKDLIYTMCAKDPDQRVQSMQKLLQLLDAETGKPVVNRPRVETPAETLIEPKPSNTPPVKLEPKPAPKPVQQAAIQAHDTPPEKIKKPSKLIAVFISVIVVVAIVVGIILLQPRHKEEAEPFLDEVLAVAVDNMVQMVPVPGGTFRMGNYGKFKDEKPSHMASVSDFMIGRYEVKNREWQETWAPIAVEFSDPELPVQNVTWLDAVKFCNKLSERAGLTPCYTINGWDVTWDRSANGFRLPTETEWEYAAGGGNQNSGYKYSGSNNLGNVAWHSGNSSRMPHPPGRLAPNELGLYDMSGNVWEWCWDWAENYHSGTYPENYAGPDNGSKKVMRGGSWNNKGEDFACVSYRNLYNVPEYVSSSVGFRLVRNAN